MNRREKLKDFLESDRKSIKITKIVLAVIAICGVLTIVSIAPGITMAAKPFLKNKKKYSKDQFGNSFASLERNGFVKKEKCSKGWKIFLTNKGKREVDYIVIDDIKINKTKKWDKKWRFVIFDIPLRFTKARNEFRFRLEDLGFYNYQDSIWVTPFPCEKEISELTEFFGLSQYVDVLEVVRFDGEPKVRGKFFK